MFKKWVLAVLALGVFSIAVCGCEDKEPAYMDSTEESTSDMEIAKVSKAVEEVGGNVEEVKNMPGFSLKDHTGKEVKLSDYAGKTVVLEWVNYDCPFVKAHYQAGTMAGLAEKYAGKGVVWLAVNSTKYATIETNKAWAEKRQIPYPVLDDHTGAIGRLFAAKTTPHIFILNEDREIVYNGAIDNAPLGRVEGTLVKYVDEALEEITAGKTVSNATTKPYGCTVKYAN